MKWLWTFKYDKEVVTATKVITDIPSIVHVCFLLILCPSPTTKSNLSLEFTKEETHLSWLRWRYSIHIHELEVVFQAPANFRFSVDDIYCHAIQ